MHSLPDSVWQWATSKPGPHVMILGGVHGNEVTGTMLVEQLRGDLDAGLLALTAGTLTLVLGNPRAIAAKTRGSEAHADLNRVFTDARLADDADTSYEVQRARALAPLLASADLVVDLHATNKPSEPFLAVVTDTPRHREICRFFACEKILHVPATLIAGTTLGHVDHHGGAGVCFESGWVGDLSRVGEMRRSVEGILGHAGLVAPADALAPQQGGQQLFALTEAIVLGEGGFAFAAGRGQRSFEPFAAGDLLGHHAAAPLVASYDGVIVFPKIPEHWHAGAPVAFLAREATV